MANIRTDVNYTIVDGAEIIFKAPCDSCTVTGLKVYYPNSDGITVNEVFAFKDAHGNNLTDLDTFKANAMVKVILNTTDHTAYIQNADTNAYLEGRFAAIEDGTTPVGNANKLGGKGASEYRQKTQTRITTLPTPTEEIDYFVNGADATFPVDYGELEIRYGATPYEYTALYKTWTGVYFNFYTSGEWVGWKTLATTADLANYLQKDWDIATNFRIGWNEWCGAPGMRFEEKDGTIQCYLSAGGLNQLYRKTPNGASYEVIDSGNVGEYAIAKYGGQGNRLYLTNPDGVEHSELYKNNSATADYGTIIRDANSVGSILDIELSANNNKAYFIGTDRVSKEIHHDGNSAKVAIQSTAPSDTTALWVW